jgi:hypothetical protein
MRSIQAGVALAAAVLSSLAASPLHAQAALATRAGDADAGSSYLLRQTTVWYNRFNNGYFTHGAAYADFNKDGRVDVLVASGTGQNQRTPVKIMIDTGLGWTDQTATRLSNAQPGLIHARKAIVGDYNGDGWPDVFVAGHGYDQPPFPGEYPQLFLSNGDGTLRYDNQLEALVGFDHAAASGDVDGNGSVDILVVQQGAPYLLINDGAGHFSKNTARMPDDVQFKNHYTGELVDVDRDGYLDMLLGGHEFEGAETEIYWGDGSGSFSSQRKLVLPTMPGKAIVMDFACDDINGDGLRDLVVLRTGESPFYSGRALQVIRQYEPRRFADETAGRMTMDTSQGWLDFIRLQDMDGDQSPDIFVDNANEKFTGEYAWRNNRGGGFAPWIGTVKPAPALSIAYAATAEGNAGTKALRFTVQSSQPVVYPVTFSAATLDGTAVAGQDYDELTVVDAVIPAGQDHADVDVTVRGDTAVERHEGFTLNLADVSGATVARRQARGRIDNDDLPLLFIGDATVVEGDAGQATLRFPITLSRSVSTPVTFNIVTLPVSAAAGVDFVLRSRIGMLLDAGRTSGVFEVNVIGDTAVEPDETLTVQVSNVSGAIGADTMATGTIGNDDVAALQPARAAGVALATPAPSECSRLAARIAAAERSAAGGRSSQAAAIRAIARDERERAALRCPGPAP